MIGIIWVCIDNTANEHRLSVGKKYTEILNKFADLDCILIKDDNGMISEVYQPGFFIKIDEWRDSQLRKIGIK